MCGGFFGFFFFFFFFLGGGGLGGIGQITASFTYASQWLLSNKYGRFY